jgi:hypothetical protein
VAVRVGKDGETAILRRHRSRAMRASHVTRLLAAEAGHEELVPASIEKQMPRTLDVTSKSGDRVFEQGRQVMVMEDLAPHFKPGNEAPQTWRDRIPEATRLTAAILDLLTQQRDRKLANMMVDREGHVRLIDPDNTFVSQQNRPAYRSQFFRGGLVAYESKQESLADLPERLQEVVRDLANAPLRELEKELRLPTDEAAIVQYHAKNIIDRGLTWAADEYVRSLPGVRKDR